MKKMIMLVICGVFIMLTCTCPVIGSLTTEQGASKQVDFPFLTNDGHEIQKGDAIRVYQAIEMDDPAVVDMLIKIGIQRDSVDKSGLGLTLLHWVVGMGLRRIVSKLIEAGADKNIRNGKGMTPLHSAVCKENEVIVDLLLKANVDKNERDGEGMTPLHCAAFRGKGVIVDLLLKANADKNSTDQQGWTPLHWAVVKGCSAIVDMLLRAGAYKERADISLMRPLHCAVVKGHHTIVKMLLDAGTDKEAQAKDDMRPLHYAVVKGHETIVEMLLDAGVGVEHPNKFGNKPLSMLFIEAFINSEVNNYPKIICMLLVAGNASLEGIDSSLEKNQGILEKGGLDHRTLKNDLKKKNELFEKYFQAFINQLEAYGIPKGVGRLVFGYYDCVSVRLLLFEKVKAGF